MSSLAGGSASEHQYQPIDEQLGLSQFGGSTKMYNRMLSLFARDYLPKGMEIIREAAKRNDVAILRNESHSLKGSCGFVGATQLFDMCSRLLEYCGLGLLEDEPGMADSESDETSKSIITQLLAQMEAEFQLIVLYFERKHKVSIVQIDKSRMSLVSKKKASDVFTNLLCSRLHVLLVEDNDFTAELLTSMMQERRMVVSRARNGTEALQMVGVLSSPDVRSGDVEDFDVLLMDVSLGTGSFAEGVDGISSTKKIRDWERATSVKEANHVPVIGLSANQKHCQRCLEAGMNTFQLKPIQETRLMQSILQCCLETRQSRQAKRRRVSTQEEPKEGNHEELQILDPKLGSDTFGDVKM
jgi:CheY-like chemotaxis protein